MSGWIVRLCWLLASSAMFFGIGLQHDLRTILQCFPQMYRLDFFAPSQICDGARQFQDAMISTRRQIELSHAQHDVAARIKL